MWVYIHTYMHTLVCGELQPVFYNFFQLYWQFYMCVYFLSLGQDIVCLDMDTQWSLTNPLSIHVQVHTHSNYMHSPMLCFSVHSPLLLPTSSSHYKQWFPHSTPLPMNEPLSNSWLNADRRGLMQAHHRQSITAAEFMIAMTLSWGLRWSFPALFSIIEFLDSFCLFFYYCLSLR